MPRKFALLVVSILAACLVAASLPGRARASAPQQTGTIANTVSSVVRLVPLDPQPLGKPITATAVLTDSNGNPIPNLPVNFLIGSSFVAQNRTNSQGQSTVTIKSDFAAGQYALRAIFLGSHQYDGSNAQVSLVIQPSVLVVQTVPALEGIRFKLGDQIFTSGKDGFARLQVDRTGDYTLQALSSGMADPNVRVDFYRWSDETYLPYQVIHIPQAGVVQAGFQLANKVGQHFIDLQNKPVNPDRISLITLKSSQGTTYNFVDGTPRWLPASLVTRRSTGLEVVPIQYSVITVIVDGSNVVSSEQQRFYTHPGEIWPIQLLLFSAQFSSRDALLGTPAGKGIELEYPNGSKAKFFYGKNHTISIDSLARGIYHVQVIGATGFAPSTPVALSQNQVMAISVLSQLDIFMGVSLAAALGLGLIVVGRTQILERRRVRRPGGDAPPAQAARNRVPEQREG